MSQSSFLILKNRYVHYQNVVIWIIHRLLVILLNMLTHGGKCRTAVEETGDVPFCKAYFKSCGGGGRSSKKMNQIFVLLIKSLWRLPWIQLRRLSSMNKNVNHEHLMSIRLVLLHTSTFECDELACSSYYSLPTCSTQCVCLEIM